VTYNSKCIPFENPPHIVLYIDIIIYGFVALCYLKKKKNRLVIFFHSFRVVCALFIYHYFYFFSIEWKSWCGMGIRRRRCRRRNFAIIIFFNIRLPSIYFTTPIYIYINTTTDAAQRYFTARSFARQAGQMSKKKHPFRISNGCVMLLKYQRTSNDAAGIWQDIVRACPGWNIIDFNIFTMRCSSCTQSNCLAKINFIPTYYNDGGSSEYYYVRVIVMKYLKRYGSAIV